MRDLSETGEANYEHGNDTHAYSARKSVRNSGSFSEVPEVVGDERAVEVGESDSLTFAVASGYFRCGSPRYGVRFAVAAFTASTVSVTRKPAQFCIGKWVEAVRFDARQIDAVLRQCPPRSTWEPLGGGPLGSTAG